MGARISERRRNKGLTQETLAKTLGVSNQAVSKWESDVCCPDIALLPQLVDALEMTLDELFGRESKAAPANDQVLPVAAELPWEDDDSIHAVLFQGHRLLLPREGSLFRHDKYDEIRRSVELHFSGSVQDIDSDFSVVCTDSTIGGNVKAGGGVTCGDIGGSVAAGDSVRCASVGGDVQAGDGVTCSGEVKGNVRAGDSVSCGSVGGDVTASDGVRCGDVQGSVRAGDSVHCSTVVGDVNADSVRFAKDGKGFPFTTR